MLSKVKQRKTQRGGGGVGAGEEFEAVGAKTHTSFRHNKYALFHTIRQQNGQKMNFQLVIHVILDPLDVKFCFP